MVREVFSGMLRVLVLATALGGVALAQQGGGGQGGGGQGGGGQGNGGSGGGISAPEFDPLAAGAVAAIVAGGAVMMARRHRNRSS